ncbi:DUF1853 family protein [Psychroserpens sp. Hel_I_66]|uniref:DUF1853 family protein n=1 Tax=Psychroserpens sp. Hel_I_66 TaxID=1250004 RepID=UPI000647F926|nr:DUF1853 family protein [Psychroserpens sp. Hel_I_66]
MIYNQKHLQDLYQGYCNTPALWEDTTLFDIYQLHLEVLEPTFFLRKLNRKLRLGQLAEQFVFNQLEAHPATEILAENIQVQKNRITLGELDTLIIQNNEPVHLEIVYKFYVYDKSLGDKAIERWIGPNRKDSLVEKLTKLKTKQLPLLYTQDCKNTLQQLQLDHYSFKQRVIFKAQLFVPYKETIEFKQLNKTCVLGFYFNLKQIDDFKQNQFYIPPKLDWFLNPHDDVEWLDFLNFRSESNTFLNNKQSPLFWMKNKRELPIKCFLVWW